ncbi:hypothetical protein [Botryobacter ruber]|uniref:hypothetical protein n=1 Tax=Botryobacter ruber TaxID=2171629 RepID=UPI000E0BFE22|nr:hypothetical protein [Botryobacter ruber]
MNKISLVMVVALLALLGASCKKFSNLLTFYINHEESIYVPATVALPIGGILPVSPVPVTTNSKDTFKNNKTSADLVKDVSLDRLVLTITDPQQQTFDFLQSIEIYITTDGNDEVLLAHLNQIPANATSLTLISSNAKLDKYIKADTYTIRTKATLAKPLAKDTTIKAAMRFKVTADPL